MMFYFQSTAKGHIKAKQNVCITKKMLIHYLKHFTPLKFWRLSQKMKLNEPGRQVINFGRYRSPVRTPKAILF